MFFLVPVLVVAGVSVTEAVDREHIKGMKSLLHGLDGVYATCSIAMFAKRRSFDRAEEDCKNFTIGTSKAGNLATVNDEDKNTDLKILLDIAYPWPEVKNLSKWASKRWVWAGLRKVKNDGNRAFTKKYIPGDWQWADESSPTNFSMWMRKQPDQRRMKYGRQGCKEVPRCYQNQMRINHKGRWDDTYRYKKHPYACDYRGRYIISGTHRTWEEAREMCKGAGLHLASIRNKAEIDEIVEAAQQFLGPVDPELKRFSAHNWIWIGGFDDQTEGNFVWDGTGETVDVASLPFLKKMPDNAKFLHEYGQNVLAISKWGKFDDSYLSAKRKRPFACQCPGF